MSSREACFRPGDFLIPHEALLPDWAVIACDQFTSEPEYWRAVFARAEGKPSACRLIFPEAELGPDDDARAARIDRINQEMARALGAEIFRAFPHSYVYVERTLLSGVVRRGILGVIDLEAYDYSADAVSPIRATERTVLERIPPRVRIRERAPLELSHVLLLADDAEGTLFDPVTAARGSMRPLYSFELMAGGGHIAAWLLDPAQTDALTGALNAYEARLAAHWQALGVAPMCYAVGDGNHSLATAKQIWEARKQANPALAGREDPARYAMVELENIRDEAQVFEPIHRLLTGVDTVSLRAALAEITVPEGGLPVTLVTAGGEERLALNPALGELAVGILQPFLDRYLQQHAGAIDYIHGDETARRLARQPDTAALLLPAIGKGDFFRGIALGGVLPRKTFSMGHAQEKRYYIEARRIVPNA